MKNTVLTYIDGFRHNRHERLVLASVLLVLALIVSLLVYWQLRLHGIAITNETFCGYEEHTHTEECYEYTFICGLEESEGHTHDESCYDEEGNLVCGLEESEGHTHIDECYEETLVCETPEHVHTVECLIDLNADVEDYEIWEATLPEITGDLRTDVVSIAYSQLDYTESTSNYTIGEDGETHYGYTRYGAWYGNEYGTWDSMFAAFCLHYAGIDESVFPVNSGAYAWAVQLQEAGVYSDAADYTPSAGDIVFFDTDYDGRVDRTGVVASTDTNAGVVIIIEGDYTVSEAATVCEHIYALSDPTIVGYGVLPVTEEAEVEETDAEDTDTEETESEETEEIEEDSEETEDEETDLWFTEEMEEPVLTTLVYYGSDYIITAVYGENALLPENVTLIAYEYSKDSENYLSRYAEAAELYGWSDEEDYTDLIRLFNIGFYDEYGNEIQPSSEVRITITYLG